jgi:hypothetical protein
MQRQPTGGDAFHASAVWHLCCIWSMWPSTEQQYLLAGLADALEAKGLVQGQVVLLLLSETLFYSTCAVQVERVLHVRMPVI